MIDENKCCGCGVCVQVCPTTAISIKLSSNGFWRPKIEMEKCIQCNLCVKVCTCQNLSKLVYNQIQIPSYGYSVIHKDPEMLSKVTSGGAGWAIAQVLMKKGWYAVGVRYDANRGIACHFKASNIKEFQESRNSKYLPSFTCDAFSQLWDGKRYVVFGTPCQIDSLRKLIRLKNIEDNFILVDFFCHGVPSYLLWNSYLAHILKEGEVLENALFRDKCNGWHLYTLNLKTNKRNIISKLKNHDYFLNLFLANVVLDEPCYTCRFRKCSSSADIRIGDFWGMKFSSNETGVSGVLAFNQKGIDIIEQLTDICIVHHEDIAIITAEQISNSLPIPKCRKSILRLLQKKTSLSFIYLRYGWKIMIKNIIPYSVKVFFKRLLKKGC